MTTLTASDVAARRIHEARKKRGWTVRELAAACEKAGAAKITPAVITNLENRHRRPGREISADELLALAWVLGVPPLQLLAPIGDGETLQVVPGEDKGSFDAVGWLTDDDVALPSIWRSRAPSESRRMKPGVSPLTILRQIRAAARELRYYDRLTRDPALRLGETEKSAFSAAETFSWRILGLLGAMELLEYPQMTPPEAELVERYNPDRPDEWDRSEVPEEGDPVG